MTRQQRAYCMDKYKDRFSVTSLTLKKKTVKIFRKVYFRDSDAVRFFKSINIQRKMKKEKVVPHPIQAFRWIKCFMTPYWSLKLRDLAVFDIKFFGRFNLINNFERGKFSCVIKESSNSNGRCSYESQTSWKSYGLGRYSNNQINIGKEIIGSIASRERRLDAPAKRNVLPTLTTIKTIKNVFILEITCLGILRTITGCVEITIRNIFKQQYWV